MPVLSNKYGAELEIYLFSDKTVGFSANERFIEGDDCFDENEFLKALWALYPDGVPQPKPEPLSHQEKQIRALTVFYVNEQRAGDYDNTPYTVDDYDEMMQHWNISGPRARERAEKSLAIVESVEDED